MVLVLGLGAPSPTAGAVCSDSTVAGTFVGWEPGQNLADSSDDCFGFFCKEAADTGTAYRIVPADCDPSAGEACGLQLRVSLEMEGNHQEDFAAARPKIAWFDESTPCDPEASDCTAISQCGSGGEIMADTGETFLQVSDLACFELEGRPQLRTYSLAVFRCDGSRDCETRHDVPNLSLTPSTVAAELGCPEIPRQSCEDESTVACRDCLPGGMSVGGGGAAAGGPGSPGNPAPGGGAFLFYAAGGAGFTGLPGAADWSATLGRGWSHTYARRIVADPDESHVWLITPSAVFREWSDPDPTTGVYATVSPSDEDRTLTWTGSGWALEELDGTVHAFGSGGLWQSTTDRNGNTTSASYSSGVLSAVDFPDERSEEFTYYPTGDPAEGKLATITEVGVDDTTSRVWSYSWSGNDLTRVDRPDGTAIVYGYDDSAHPGFLTRIELEGADGTSTRIERAWEYDADGNAIATWRGDASKTGPNAADVWELAFDDPVNPTATTVTDPLGQEITYQLGRDTVSDNVKVTSIAGDCPVCGLGPNVTLAYDDPDHPLLPTSRTSGRGFTTVMSYDANGQRTSRTEAMGEPEERTTTWTYDSTYPGLVTSREVPSVAGGGAFRTTEWLRDADGNATTRRITGMEAGSAFSHETATTFNAAGRPLEVDPPGHGTDDVTSFTYDAARGDLVADSRTDPLVGTTDFAHDPFNRRTAVTDPNGVTTETDYDALDRVTAIRRAAGTSEELVTTHEHTTFGDLLRTTLPEGNVIEYGYDEAGRLLSIERKPDASTPGERTLYTLDAAGNRTREELQRWDTDAAAWVTVSETEFESTSRCQVDRIVQAIDPGEETPEEAVTVQEYDCNGNLSARWDANHDATTDLPTTSYTYDALDRLTAVTQPWGGVDPGGGGDVVTSYAYDVQDHLVEVTDAEANTTTYTYSDRDLLTQEVSPVSGTTTHVYDEHGALTETTDARGVTVTRTLDALDRVTAEDYPGTALDVTYSYDTAPGSCTSSFPVGRLGSITRDGQSIELCYDRFGRTTRDGELTYQYDGNGNRTVIEYPGTVQSTTTYDFADRPETLTVTSPGGTEPVVTAAGYLPSGPLTGLELGSGTTETRVFDGRSVPSAVGVSGNPAGIGDRTWSYTTDRVGNVLEIVEEAVCPDAPVVLESQTITTTETFTSCSDLQAGNGFSVEDPGDVTVEAQGAVILTDGFSVGSGASLTAGAAGAPELSRRSFGYQDVQYFLTSASGVDPEGPEDLSWTYDGIGNRLTETRSLAGSSGTPETDIYVYATNPDGGNTPILDQVSLAVGGTRDYTWGAAGHLEEVAAGANVLDFAADSAGRLSSADRSSAGETAAFAYDGRSFLNRAEQTAGGTRSVQPIYDSAGLVHVLERQASPSDPIERIVFVYLAGRPVAQLEIAADGTETWTYLTTDHLGTPLVATDDQGAVVWEGGFQPFGTDWQAGTPAGALQNGIHLRLPGQWDEQTWQDATSGADVYYNVHRWYSPGVGTYTRPDPLALNDPLDPVYVYARGNPLLYVDSLGLAAEICCRLLGNMVAGTILRQRHCYVVADGGTVYGLYPQQVGGQTLGVPRRNDSRDTGGTCYQCPCGSGGNSSQDQCLENEFQSYPIGMYKRLGPNSNTFAGTLGGACCQGGLPPGIDNAPGLTDSPPPDTGLRPVPDTRP